MIFSQPSRAGVSRATLFQACSMNAACRGQQYKRSSQSEDNRSSELYKVRFVCFPYDAHIPFHMATLVQQLTRGSQYK